MVTDSDVRIAPALPLRAASDGPAPRLRRAALIGALTLLAAACGGSDTTPADDTADVAPASDTTAPDDATSADAAQDGDAATPDDGGPDGADDGVTRPDVAPVDVVPVDTATPDDGGPDGADDVITRPDVVPVDVVPVDTATPDDGGPDGADDVITRPDVVPMDVVPMDVVPMDVVPMDVVPMDVAPRDTAGDTTPGDDTPEACARCPLAGTFDGAACLIATAPAGSTAFVAGGAFYLSALPSGGCPAGTTLDTTGCYVGPVPASATGYAYANKLYVTPACCPCPARGHFDGANCFVAEAPAGSAPFIAYDQFYIPAGPGGACPLGTFDGANCAIGHNPGGSVPFLVGQGLYLASACAHTTPDPANAATQPATAPPPVGALCAPGFGFDGAHCKLGDAPAGTTAFNSASRFYHTPVPGQPTPPLWTSGGACPAPALYDGANCERYIVPAGYAPFILDNAWFTDINPNLVFHSQGCPPGFSYDGANCLLGTAPPGRTASIKSGRFVFNKPVTQSCSSLYPGSSLYLTIWCEVARVPDGHDAFVYANSWYVGPTPGTPGTWLTRHYGPGTASELVRPVCLADGGPRRTWHLLWADEFGDAPDGSTCYTADDRMTCVTEPYWGQGVCADSPTAWDAAGRATWSAAQHARYDGLVNLDKCHWQVMDAYDMWSGEGGSDAFDLDTVRVEDGMLRLTNRARPGEGPFDCGRNRNQTGAGAPDHTKNCPYIGAHVVSSTWNPWLVQGGHSPSHPDPTKRYVGRAVGPGGRIEFRARIAALGHGAWPSLWLFSDHLTPGSGETHNGELDALELIADQNGPDDALSSHRLTSGMAWQTGHDWAPTGDVAEGMALPISVGEWHLYAVEWDDHIIRFYLDGCLRQVLTDGQPVKNPWTGVTSTFHIPRDTTYNILIGNPASKGMDKAWDRASVDANGNPRPDFIPTRMDVDYVRFYAQVGP